MPIQRRKVQAVVILFSILSILTIDQYSKYLVRTNLAIGDSIPLINNALHITFVGNTGAAFGLFKQSTMVFAAISLIAVFFITTLIIKTVRRDGLGSRPVFNAGLILILSGAVGNLIDRLLFSYVIDFIDVRIWPVFNIADSSITIGTALLVLSALSRPTP